MATVFCDCGTAWLAELINDTLPNTTYAIMWGEATGTVSKAQFEINSPAQDPISAGASISAFNQNQWTATMTASAVRSITQAGLFQAESLTMLVAGDFSTLALATNDRIEFTITLTST